MTFRGALKVLGKTETPLIDKLDTVLGGAIIVAGVGAGIAATGGPAGAAILAPVWGWVDQKNEAGGILRRLVTRFGPKINGVSGLERRQLVTAAHSAIVVAAYFDVFHEVIAEAGFGGFELTAKEQAQAVFGQASTSLLDHLYSSEIPAPSATWGYSENVARVEAWLAGLHHATFILLSSLSVRGLLGQVKDHLSTVTGRASDRYQTYYGDLATSVTEFQIWFGHEEHAATRTAMDNSFRELKAMLTALGTKTRPAPAAESLELANTGKLYDTIISTDVPWPDTTFGFPTVGELFVPPGFRICAFDATSRASDDDWWAQRSLQHNLADRLAAHLLSTDSARTPLLLLGHPGAGKSMLMKVLAASLPADEYATVNVRLRDVNAHASVLDQIQESLDYTTNKRVGWARLAEETADRMRVVLLDGLDELLLAANLDRTGFLHEIVRFQQVEADQKRPVAVVVTSRTVVADRITIPEETPIVKLAEFDDGQIDQWITRWDRATPGLATAAGARRLTAEEALRQPHLARQPLLLMLLALYAISPGSTELDANTSQASLYDHLFTRFAGRETTKDASHTPSPDEARDLVKATIDRLSVAALAMFNRGRQHIGEVELGIDLKALGQGIDTQRPKESGQRLLMEFFFIHVNEATVITGGPAERSYEFLHATFGEYLVGRKVIEVLRDIADTAYNGRKQHNPDDDLLHALLSHQALVTQRPILQFVEQLFHSLPEREREQIIEVLEFLIDRWRARPPSKEYLAYRPLVLDNLRELAAYSANLVMVRLALADDRGLTRSPQLFHDWSAMVTLWNSGLDPDAWRATLGAMILDRHDGTIHPDPDPNPYVFDEFDSARLRNDRETAEELGIGAVVRGAGVNFFPADNDWMPRMRSFLLSQIIHGNRYIVRSVGPPPETTDSERDEIARLITHVLRTQGADLEIHSKAELVKLLLGLDPVPDPIALALALSQHPALLTEIPALGNAEIFDGNVSAALLLLHPDEHKGPMPDQWWELYEAIVSVTGYRHSGIESSRSNSSGILESQVIRDIRGAR